MTREEVLALGRKAGAAAGGRAVKHKQPPESCGRCGQLMTGRSWHSRLRVGHLGLHGLADNYFGGDLKAAQQRLQTNGLARQDTCTCAGASVRLPGIQPGVATRRWANRDWSGCNR